MKLTNYFLTGLAAVALSAAGCSREPEVTPYDGETGSIAIKITSETPGARADFGGLLTTPAELLTAEGAINDYMIYVFDETTRILQAAVAGDPSKTTTISGIPTMGTKRVVVVANGTAAGLKELSVDSVNHTFDYFRSLPIDVLSQNTVATDIAGGLVMTGGKSGVDVGSTSTLPITISRTVAKVKLGDISFDPGIPLSEMAKFAIDGVGIQRALSKVTFAPSNLTAYADPVSGDYLYYGSFDDASVSTVPSGASVLQDVGTGFTQFITDLIDPTKNTILNTLLQGAITLGLFQDLADLLATGNYVIDDIVPGSGQTISNTFTNFYYVLPNAPAMYAEANDFLSTLLTLKVTYDGTEYYYPIEINGPAASNVTGTDGTYIAGNTIYTVNIRILDLKGMEDPDSPAKPANIQITVTPSDWITGPTQTTTW